MRVLGWFLALMFGAAMLAGCSSSANEFTWETGEQPVRAELVKHGLSADETQPSSLNNVRVSMVLPDGRENTVEASRMRAIVDPDSNDGPSSLDDPIDWVEFQQPVVGEDEVVEVMAAAATQFDAPFDTADFEEWLVSVSEDSRAGLGYTAYLDPDLRYVASVSVVKTSDNFYVSATVDFLDEEQRADPELTQVVEQSAWRNG